jgi:hypothetical protein
MFVFGWIAVEKIKEEEIEKAEQARDGKAYAPAEVKHQETNDRNADGGSKFCHGIEDSGGQAAFRLWKPVADGFCVGGKGGGFADTEKKTGAEERGEARGNSGGEGSHAPEERADPADQLHAKPIEKQTGRKLQGSIGQAVSAEEIAVGDFGDAERLVKAVLGDGKIDAVKIVDQNTEAQEASDAPTTAWDSWRFRGGGVHHSLDSGFIGNDDGKFCH